MERFHRRSIRLKGYNYSRPGYYFVTVCTKERECLLGEIASSAMLLNEMGEMAERIWHEIPTYFPNILMDQCMIMPNHFHVIIRILEKNHNKGTDTEKGLMNQTPTLQRTSDSDYNSTQWIMMKNPAVTLGKIIRFFKARSTQAIRKNMGISFYWQRNYYEHLIHDENELSRIREYIRENPANWSADEDNPLNIIKG